MHSVYCIEPIFLYGILRQPMFFRVMSLVRKFFGEQLNCITLHVGLPQTEKFLGRLGPISQAKLGEILVMLTGSSWDQLSFPCWAPNLRPSWMVLCTSGSTLKFIIIQKSCSYFCTNGPSHGGLVQLCTEESEAGLWFLIIY